MKDFELINYEKFETNRNILDEEFEQLINDDFQLSSTHIAFATWLDEYLKFVDDVKDGKTYIIRIDEFEKHLYDTATKYPFYQNSNLFDPESLFSQNELDFWNNTIKYFQDLKSQSENLIKSSEELMFDLYCNKFKRLNLISSNLIEVLSTKKRLNSESLISDELIKHLGRIIEDEPKAKNPYPKIFVNDSAYSLFLELIEELKNDRHDKKLIKEDVTFIIDKLKNVHNKVKAIKLNVKLTVLCDFFNQFESTQHLAFKSKNIKYNRENKRLNEIFNPIIKKYNLPFKDENEH